MHIFDKFEYLCKLKGVKEAEAYKEMGINKGTISLWRTARDNGEDVTPSTKNAVKLSKYFGYSTDYFLQGNQLTPEQIEKEEKPAAAEQGELTEVQQKAINTVERVKALCRERKIPISRLEKDLGYGNGYIGQLRKGVFPHDRLIEIARYLNVSAEYLAGEEQKKPALPQENELTEMQQKAFDVIKNMTDDQLKAFIAAAEAFLR